jgi:hypothetical protein
MQIPSFWRQHGNRVPLRLRASASYICHFFLQLFSSLYIHGFDDNMTKKITSFFQVTSIPKGSQRGKISGAKRARDDDGENGFFAALENSDEVTPKTSDDCASPAIDKNRRSSPRPDRVNELISFLCDDVYENLSLGKSIALVDQAVDQESHGKASCSWMKALRKHFQTASFQNLAEFVARERQTYKIYPPPASVWSALNSCPLHMVKVVIVGQDPYHGHKQAHGLSFSVEPGCAVPPSLKNMYVSVAPSLRGSNEPRRHQLF